MRIIFVVIALSIIAPVFAQHRKPFIEAVYPTTDSIPSNILRFYVRFSQPMQEIGILKHILLKNAAGLNITGVFFDNDNELWNDDLTEVTLLVDPGRVKTGLVAHNKFGWAFDEGERYRLMIDSLLFDFNDRHLSATYRKELFATTANNIAPDIRDWKVSLPKRNTQSTLVLDFTTPLDHISASTLIRILDTGGNVIKGKVFLGKKEKIWHFKPSAKWKPGNYTIEINSDLEDIVGNSLRGVFNHPIGTLKPVPDIQFLHFKIE